MGKRRDFSRAREDPVRKMYILCTAQGVSQFSHRNYFLAD